jgi:cytochrome c oxidase subunit II
LPWRIPPLLSGDTAAQFSDVLHPFLVVLVAAFVVVNGALLVAAIAFRDRAGRTARPASPHHVVTAVYVALLAAVAVVLAIIAIRSEDRVDAASVPAAVTVKVIASQWRWTFVYPGGRRSQTLVVPVGKELRFELRSRDVLHGMYVPALRFKRYAYPDRWNVFELSFDRTGTFLGECSQFCGWDHSGMRFAVRVLTAAGYAGWAGGAG